MGSIDHHEEENKVPEECGEEMRIVRKSGSCASLVVEYCREAWDSSSQTQQMEEMKVWDAELARLAIAPVLIDTNNLISESKTTPVDIESVEFLESRIVAHEGEKYSREVYFKEISKAKEDIINLDLHDILRKDYKQWTAAGMKLGVSSIVKDIQSLIQKVGSESAFLKTVTEFAQERELSIVSLMTTSHVRGEFTRELLVWGLDEKGVQAVKKFENDSKEALGLEKWGDESLDLEDGKQWRRCWWQYKLDNSRKQVAPLLRTSIEETK